MNEVTISKLLQNDPHILSDFVQYQGHDRIHQLMSQVTIGKLLQNGPHLLSDSVEHQSHDRVHKLLQSVDRQAGVLHTWRWQLNRVRKLHLRQLL